MSLQTAITCVKESFPFEGYIDGGIDSYRDVVNTVLKYLQPGDEVLDFGSGPCDKTALVQSLGFNCTAYDDLSDPWHLLDNNGEKIIAFAEEFGIRFIHASDRGLPFEKNSFDMVMLIDVIEHFHNSPRELLNNLIGLMKPRGYIFITVPNAVNIKKRIAVLLGKTNYQPYEYYYWFPGPWRGHVREYVKDDLLKLVEFLNLDLCEIRSTHHMHKRLNPILRTLYIFLTKIFPGWRDSWLLIARKPATWLPRKKQGNVYERIWVNAPAGLVNGIRGGSKHAINDSNQR